MTVEGAECGIEELELTVTAAAKMLNVSRSGLSNLINGKPGISPEMAVRLSKTIGSTPAFWLRLQMNYDLAEVKKQEDRIIVNPIGLQHQTTLGWCDLEESRLRRCAASVADKLGIPALIKASA
ncbi:MAG: HigA family addiction module antitoxin [Microcystis panniformis]